MIKMGNGEKDIEEITEKTKVNVSEELKAKEKLFKEGMINGINNHYLEMMLGEKSWNEVETKERIDTIPIFLEEAVRKESKDIEWESELKRVIEEVLEDERFVGTKLKEIDCGSEICKTIYSHVNSIEQKIFIRNGGEREELKNTWLLCREDEEEEVYESYIYVLRGENRISMDDMLQKIDALYF